MKPADRMVVCLAYRTPGSDHGMAEVAEVKAIEGNLVVLMPTRANMGGLEIKEQVFSLETTRRVGASSMGMDWELEEVDLARLKKLVNV